MVHPIMSETRQTGDIRGPVISAERCTRCGRCIDVCRRRVLQMTDDGVGFTDKECMFCAHCYAVCPADAVSFDGILHSPGFSSFTYRERVLHPGEPSTEELINLLRSRRSTRLYSENEVSDSLITDCIEGAVTAPSGSNWQLWNFTVVNGRQKAGRLAALIGRFYRRINRLAANPLLRYLTIPFMGTKLLRYYRDHYSGVEFALQEAEKGNDLLFHGAPAVVIIHGPEEGSTPVEDAQYAALSLVLTAHTLGLGTCFIGYATETLNRAPSVKQWCKIPPDHRVHAVIVMGYPAVKFLRPALRKQYSVHII